MLRVEELKPTKRNLRAFIRLPFVIYKDDPNWVPPLVFDQMRTLSGKHNGLFDNGIHKFFMVYEGRKPVARVLAGIDYKLVERTGVKEGYVSLFESYNQPEAAKLALDAAADYLRAEGMDIMIGPNPATFDDFNKGMLVMGFDGPPVLFNAYNDPYMMELFENYGFTKYCDHYAYDMTLQTFEAGRFESLVERAQHRFGFRVQEVNLKGDVRPVLRDIARVVAEAFPRDWNLLPPTEEDIYHEFMQLKSFVDTRFALLAYAGDRPVGFVLALPDYNVVIKKMKGRLTPRGLFYLLTERKKIKTLRAVMQFVVPDYQNKAVNGVMFYKLFVNAIRAGVTGAECSTIDENNTQSILSMEKAGGKLYRKYRQYVYKLR